MELPPVMGSPSLVNAMVCFTSGVTLTLFPVSKLETWLSELWRPMWAWALGWTGKS